MPKLASALVLQCPQCKTAEDLRPDVRGTKHHRVLLYCGVCDKFFKPSDRAVVFMTWIWRMGRNELRSQFRALMETEHRHD